MLDVAVARIEAEGMTVGLDNLRMERVIDEAGVSRATAYRRWSTRDEFVADVLVEVVRRTSLIPETESDIARIVALVRDRLPLLDTEQGRRDLVVEALRVAIDADARRILASPRWRTFLSLSATYPGLPPGRVRDHVGAALAEAEIGFSARRATTYANLCGLIGYRLVPPLTAPEGFGVLGSAAGAMMTGLALRALPRPAWLDERTPARLFGQSQPADWSEPERHLAGVLFAHLEPDPDIAWGPETVAALLARFEGQVTEMLALPSHAPGSAGEAADGPEGGPGRARRAD